MCQSCLEDKLENLIALKQELTIVFTNVKVWSHVFSWNEIQSLCDRLLTATSLFFGLRNQAKIIYGVKWFSVSIDEWLKELQRYEESGLPENWFGISDELQHAEIWEHWNRTYWFQVIEPLISWWSAGHAQLGSVEWRSSTRYIEIVVMGSGDLVGRHRFNDAVEFWTLDVGAEPTGISPKLLNAELLLAQLAAKQGGGTLAVSLTQGKQISMLMEIPRADVISCPDDKISVLSVDTAMRTVNRITRMVISALVDMGCRLELALLRKLEQLEVSAGKDKDETVRRVQEKHKQLVLLLQTLEVEVMDWQTDHLLDIAVDEQ